MIMGLGLVGVLIFVYMLLRGTSASDQINMEIGLAIAALAAATSIGAGISMAFSEYCGEFRMEPSDALPSTHRYRRNSHTN